MLKKGALKKQTTTWSCEVRFREEVYRVSCERGMPEATWLLLITQQYPISSDIGDLTSGYLMISYDIYPKGSCKSFPEAMDCRCADLQHILVVKPSMEMMMVNWHVFWCTKILLKYFLTWILHHIFVVTFSGTLSMLLHEYALRRWDEWLFGSNCRGGFLIFIAEAHWHHLSGRRSRRRSGGSFGSNP